MEYMKQIIDSKVNILPEKDPISECSEEDDFDPADFVKSLKLEDIAIKIKN